MLARTADSVFADLIWSTVAIDTTTLTASELALAIDTTALAVRGRYRAVTYIAALEFFVTFTNLAPIFIDLQTVRTPQVTGDGFASNTFALALNPHASTAGEAGVRVISSIDPADRLKHLGAQAWILADASAFYACLALATIVVSSASVQTSDFTLTVDTPGSASIDFRLVAIVIGPTLNFVTR